MTYRDDMDEAKPMADDDLYEAEAGKEPLATASAAFTPEQSQQAAQLLGTMAPMTPMGPPAKRARLDPSFSTFAIKLNNQIMIKPFACQDGQSYPDWEDLFIYVVSPFEMPNKYWTRLATRYLQGSTMKTWKRHRSQ